MREGRVETVEVGLPPRWPAADIALAITIIFTLLRLLISPFVGLGTNEAYAIASGRSLSLSYFDHPPLHFWLAYASSLVFGDDYAARLPFIALGAGTSWLMFALTRRLYGERAGVWATLALNLSIFFSLVSGNWILPDGPLNFFLLAAALAFAPLAEGASIKTTRWLIAGLLLGLAALSKYHAIIFAAGAFIFLILYRRDALRRPGPWLAVAVALAIFSPVLIWNATHRWVSFDFQGTRADHAHFGFGLFISLTCAQFALLSPWVAVPFARGIVSARPFKDDKARFLLWLGLPSALLFSLVPLFSDNGMVQWAMPGWLFLLPFAGRYLAATEEKADWSGAWAIMATAAFVSFAALASVEYYTAWLGDTFPFPFRHGDPTAENAEWSQLASVINVNGNSPRNFVLTSGWRDGAKIDQGLGGRYRVAVVSNDPRNFAIGLHIQAHENGWIVTRSSTPQVMLENLKNCFSVVQFVSPMTIARGVRADAQLMVWRGNGFLPERCLMRTYDGG